MSSAREKKEKYENVIEEIKSESLSIKENLISLYESQLEKIKDAINFENNGDNYSVDESEYNSVLEKVNKFEAEEIEIEQSDVKETQTEEDEQSVEEETAEEIVEETEKEIEKPNVKETNYFANENAENDFSFSNERNESNTSVEADVQTAINDFSTNEITPVRNTGKSTIEILDDDEDDDDILQKETPSIEDFGSIFGTNEVTERTTEKISLIPPEDDNDENDDDEPKFKGFFKKKREINPIVRSF